jgi:hypothetical protein
MNKFQALQILNPNIITLRGDVAEDIDGNPIEYDQAAVDAEIEKHRYKVDRAAAYPSIQEQLDMQYWDSVNGTTTWADAIAQVKADYPKGAE